MDRLVTPVAGRLQRVRDLYLVGVKFIDVFARAGFILTATYGLHIAEAGRFGLIATLVGLFAFAFNFERHIDIQRRSAGEPHPVFDRHVTQALKFFAFNWAMMVPLFVAAVALWTGVDRVILLLAVIVVVGEHISNQAYQYALINSRYYPMVGLVAVKNGLLAVIALGAALFAHNGFNLMFVMQVWAVGAALCTLALGGLFLMLKDAAPKLSAFSLRDDILSQHKASATHFLIGLIAILILQFDRLAVGGLMSFADTGLYFRHTLLVSFAYQAFNIASFNRITPSIYAAAKTHDVAYLHRRVMKEYLKIVVGVPLLLLAAWAADWLTHGVWSARFHLSLWLMALLLFGFMIRAAADFHALILNARHDERHILRAQGAAFVVGGGLLVLLTWRFGVYGAASATILTAVLYLILIIRVVHRRTS
jgi:O-antigen/teichoic acid export membrane protein